MDKYRGFNCPIEDKYIYQEADNERLKKNYDKVDSLLKKFSDTIASDIRFDASKELYDLERYDEALTMLNHNNLNHTPTKCLAEKIYEKLQKKSDETAFAPQLSIPEYFPPQSYTPQNHNIWTCCCKQCLRIRPE